METDEKRYRLVQSRVVVTSFVLLVLAFGVILGFFNGWMPLVGEHVVRAGMLSGALLLVSLVLWVLWNIRRGREKSPIRADSRWVWVRPLSYFLLLAAVATGTAMVALFDWGTKEITLDTQGPDGCRAVVRETALFGGTRGEAYAVGVLGVGSSAGKWFTYDLYRPVEKGSYTLTWGTAGGELTIYDAYVFRTRTQNIARIKALQPRIDSGEITADELYDPEPFERKPVNCH